MTTIEAPINDTTRDVFHAAIALDEMFVDRRYQRDLDERRARKIGADWDRRLVGIIDVSDRGEGEDPRYAVVNGQHRYAAASHSGKASHLVAVVHTGLTLEEEAALFRDLDATTKKLSVWDRWKARRAAGDHTVVGIDRIAEGFGFRVMQGGNPAYLTCLSTLERTYQDDPQFLSQTLELITDVWPDDAAATKAGIVRGLFEIVRTERCDSGRLADTLSDVTPSQVHARAVDSTKTYGGQQWQAVVRVIVHLYNKSGRSKVHVAEVLE
ncbi:hypothetical protein AXK56_16595 [Tsukamurella pulmonis]|uniref:ParB-like nuclease domain-containing protein n=1 Tax=Tsukamurella pulmonis TaxID=47312 RepID=A0A1H1AAL8_9ACTN|nr:DUF6551 family protein [Tsukamurella pulmonis]KXO95828.1 hypothetical protein AXK56_16595 [Tsukamurella pulmonis]SDQ36620.1 hypothetical protein SAMN04489765_0129 [Tsukamurella pulmonis]SUQ39408.1 Uncharacterised protein [Tsukamurella pulmonis]